MTLTELLPKLLPEEWSDKFGCYLCNICGKKPQGNRGLVINRKVCISPCKDCEQELIKNGILN